MSETCGRYGISRQASYVYQRRRYSEGAAALARTDVATPAKLSGADDVRDREAEIVRLHKTNPAEAPAP